MDIDCLSVYIFNVIVFDDQRAMSFSLNVDVGSMRKSNGILVLSLHKWTFYHFGIILLTNGYTYTTRDRVMLLSSYIGFVL